MIHTLKASKKYIEPLHINGLEGRQLYMPAKKNQKREILVVYGHHSSLERWWGLVQNFNDFGAVFMPDLPGFGGMDSFYKIDKDASLDNYADYLASLIKLRYKRKKVTIVGISFGFLLATRMLQRYPELTGRVDTLISAVGFMRHDDFLFSPTRHSLYKFGANIFSIPPFSYFFRYACLNAPTLRAVYARTNNAKHKFKNAKNKQAFDDMMQMEIDLWQNNDVRTYMKTSHELLTVDNCGTSVDLPVWHVYTDHDNYFDNAVIEQQMQVVFNQFHPAKIEHTAHAPSVIATKKEAAIMIPDSLRKAFL